jgi:hypothetical protein
MSRIGPREGREKDTKGIAKKKASREKKSPFPLLFVSSRLRASTASSRSSTYLVVGSSEHGPGASRRCGFLLRHGWFVFFFSFSLLSRRSEIRTRWRMNFQSEVFASSCCRRKDALSGCAARCTRERPEAERIKKQQEQREREKTESALLFFLGV